MQCHKVIKTIHKKQSPLAYISIVWYGMLSESLSIFWHWFVNFFDYTFQVLNRLWFDAGLLWIYLTFKPCLGFAFSILEGTVKIWDKMILRRNVRRGLGVLVINCHDIASIFFYCQILFKNMLGNCVNVSAKWKLTKPCIKNKKLVSYLNSNLWHLAVHLKFEYKKRHEKAYLIARWPYFKLMFPVYK